MKSFKLAAVNESLELKGNVQETDINMGIINYRWYLKPSG